MQLEQIFDQLRQEHPLFWTVECERACTELILSAGDENALVNVSEAKEQIGLWFEGGDGEAGESRGKKKMKKKMGGATSKEKGSVEDEPLSWINDTDLLQRNFVGALQGRGYDELGFLG